LTHQTLIEIRQITRTDLISNRIILHPTTLRINDGDRIGLVGPSGSGKSTLLRSLALLDPIESGNHLFLGEEVPSESIPKFRRFATYLPQHAITFEGTVRDNLTLPFSFGVTTESYSEDGALMYLRKFGRDSTFLDLIATSLSGGEQQLMAFIRCLLINPNIILFDEPTASLDSETESQFENVLEDWFRNEDERQMKPRAFIWSSHDASQLDRLANRILTMNEGKIKEEGVAT